MRKNLGMFIIGAAMLGSNSFASTEDVAPFVECKNNVDPELLLSRTSDQNLLIYSYSDVMGHSVASKVSRYLGFGFKADYMVLNALPAKSCKFENRDVIESMVSLDCSFDGGSLTVKPRDADEKTVSIKSGSVQFIIANTYDFNSKALIVLQFTTVDGTTTSIRQRMDTDTCDFATLNRAK